jgi:hypothetical protein
MGNVDEILDSMGPRELAAMEAELDKRSSEQTVAYYFNLGQKAAREALDAAEKTGDLTPELFLVKQAKGFKNLPPKVQAKIQANKKNPPGPAGGPGHGSEKHSEEIDAVLDKCSEEQLVQIEATLDAEIGKKATEAKVARYFEIGKSLAKEAAKVRVPKPKKPKTPGTPKSLGGKLTGIMKQHPGAAAAGLAGAGYLFGQSQS